MSDDRLESAASGQSADRASLERERKQYRDFLENLDAGVVAHKADTSVMFCNKRALQILGLTREQIHGLQARDPQWKFLNEDGTDMILDDYPVMRVISSKSKLERYVLGVVRADRDYVTWLLCNGIPVLTDSGEIHHVLISFFDITDARVATKKLIDAEARIRAWLENSPICTKILDVDFNLQYMSPSGFESLHLKDPEVVVGKPYPFDFYPDSFKTPMKANLKRAKETGQTITQEAPVVDVEGNEVWFHSTIVPVKDDAGELDYMLVVSLDVTDRRVAAEKLVRTERKQRAMIENIADVIAIMDKDGIVRYKSPNIERHFGWKPEDLDGVPGWETVHPDDLPRMQQEFRGLLEKPESTTTVEYRYKCKDGSYRWVELTAKSLLDDPDVEGVLLNYHDISYRKETEAKIAALARFPAENPNPVLRIAADGVVKYSNPAAAPLMRTWGCEDGGSIPSMWKQFVRDVLDGGGVQYGEVEVGERTVSLSFAPIPEAGVVNVYGMDITERVEMEANEQKLREQLERAARMESLGVLAGGVAHDLNNVLGPLVGLPDLIRECIEKHVDRSDPDYEEACESLDSMKESGKRAASVVADLVVMGRRGQFKQEPLEINGLIGELLESRQMRVLQEAHPAVQLTASNSGKELWCSGSASRLLRIMANLLGNAVEAVEGQGDVTISTRREALAHPYPGYEIVPAGDYAVIEVTDTGCGMDEDTVAKVFEPFFSLKEPSQRTGSGLGLSVVHGLVSDHSGFMDVKSELGAGTVFTVYLPLSEAGTVDHRAAPSELPRGNERILVVDDEPAQRLLASRFLKRLGYSVSLASSGTEAAALFEAAKSRGEPEPFDLVMVDMIMKDMDGIATCKAIRACYPDQKLMIASGHADDDATEESRELVTAWLSKPYSLNDLAEILRSQL